MQKQFSKELIISLKIGLFFSIPAHHLFLSIFQNLFIGVLFERGEFSSLETNQTAQALIAYAFGIPAFIIIKSCQPAFLSRWKHQNSNVYWLYIIITQYFSFIYINALFKTLRYCISDFSCILDWLNYVYCIINKKGKNSQNLNLPLNMINLIYSIVFIYALKIIFTSCLMVLIMKSIFYILNLIRLMKYLFYYF